MPVALSYNDGVPAAANNPSDDQPKMLTNTISGKSIWAVDHVTYESSGSGGTGASSGQHLQVTFNDKATPAVPVDPIAIGYTFDGVAEPSHPQLYYQNSQGVFPLSALRGFGVLTASTTIGAVTEDNGFNILSISQGASAREIHVTFNANIVNTDDVSVVATLSNGNSVIWDFTAPTLNMVIPQAAINVSAKLSFFVYQI